MHQVCAIESFMYGVNILIPNFRATMDLLCCFVVVITSVY